MLKKRYLFLILIICLFAISAVSAEEIGNDTNIIIEDYDSGLISESVNEDTLSVSLIEDEIIGSADNGTFTALQKKINDADEGAIINLENDYKYDSGFSTEGMTINKTLTINGNGYVIDALGQSRIFYITSQSVTLNNIIFKNGYADDEGGAVYWGGDDGVIVNSTFVNNSAFEGGAVYWDGGDGLLVNSTFVNNSASYSGGAVDWDGGDGLLVNSTFVNNSAKCGGAIDCGSYSVINNCAFVNNNAWSTSSESGGAIRLDGSRIMVSNCYFSDNHANVEGGAIDSYWDGNTIENCTFENNCAEYEGGAIKLGYGGTIINSKFINNSACGFSGSSVRCGDGISKGTVTVVNSQFINNSEQRTFYVLGNAMVVNSQFINNSGAPLSVYGNLIAVGSQFFNNTDGYYGGALYVEGNLSVGSSQFVNNAASKGGALYVEGNLSVGSSQFIENFADYGGAIYSHSTLNIDDSNFTDNFAFNGDAIYHYIESNMTLINSNINYNSICFSNDLYKDTYSKITLLNLNFSRYNDYEGLISMDENVLCIYRGFNPSAEATVNIAGKTFEGNFDDDGYALIDLQSLAIGTYDAIISYWDDEKSASSQIRLPITTESSTKLDVPDVTKNYGGPERLEITLMESGEPIAGADVNININGVDYTRKTDSNGEISMALNLNAGSYNATVTYKDISAVAKVTINQLTTTNTLSYTKNSHNSVTLTASVNPATATGDVVFTVNGNDYNAKISNGKATYTLSGLNIGSYEAKATYGGDVNHKASVSNSVKFTVEEVKVDVSAPDLTKYYKGPERFVVTVKEDGKAVVGKDVIINLNGATYTRTTNENGEASMAINLNSGEYKVTSEFEGIEVESTITVKSTISGENITKMFRNGTQYYATFVDSSGKTLSNGTAVEFNINGVFYTRYTNEKGVARMNINLNPGKYIITAQNPVTGEQYTNIIKVLPTIVEVHDLTKYYKNESKLTFRLLDDQGRPVGAGVNANININGVFYTRQTNASGYVNMNINLNPGTYIATLEYNGLMASSTVKVLPILSAEDITMSYKDGTKFEAKLVDGQGNPFSGQSITFNINGVFYNRPTDENGIARLAINLMAGEYIITSMYEPNGAALSNKVTVRS